MDTKQETFKAFGGRFKTVTDVPTTTERWDAWSGNEGDVVDAANSQHGFHCYLGRVRSCVVKALVAAGYARKKLSAENEKDVYEGEEVFVKRLIAEGLTLDDLNSIGNAALTKEGISFESTLKGGSSRSAIGKKYLSDAQDFIDAWEAGTDGASAARTLTKIKERLPNATLSDETDVEELARLLRDWDKAETVSALL